MKQFRDRIYENIRNYLRVKNPYMPEKNIKILQDEIINGCIEEELMNFIINLMPGREKSIREQVFQECSPSQTSRRKRLINFQAFFNILLEHFFIDYEGRITKYVNIFKEFNSENNGLLTSDKFLTAFNELEISKDAEKCLKVLDPFNSGSVNFSDFIMFCLIENGYKDESFISLKNKTI